MLKKILKEVLLKKKSSAVIAVFTVIIRTGLH